MDLGTKLTCSLWIHGDEERSAMMEGVLAQKIMTLLEEMALLERDHPPEAENGETEFSKSNQSPVPASPGA